MRRLSAIFVWVLAAIWLPATMHCGLEMAGVLNHPHAHQDEEVEDSHGCATACANEGCSSVESGNYKNPTDLAKVPAPVLSLCVFQLIEVQTRAQLLADATRVAAVAPERTDPPPELARTWQFSARTALLPGAPCLVA